MYKYIIYPLIIFIIIALSASAYVVITVEADSDPYYFIDNPSPQIAFSFEISCGEERLLDILEILGENQVRATFFITEPCLQNHLEKAKTILIKGHEIGKRSFATKSFTDYSQEQISQQFIKFNELSEELLEYQPRLYRPPLGQYNQMLLSEAQNHGYTTALWSIDARDYFYENDKDIYEHIISRLHYGAIVRFSTTSPELIKILPQVIDYIKNEGMEITSITGIMS